MPRFEELIENIPEDLRAQAEAEADKDTALIAENQTPLTDDDNAATLLVYDLIAERLLCFDQVADMTQSDKITGLLLILSREIAKHPEGFSPELRDQIDQVFDLAATLPVERTDEVLRQLAGGDPS